MTCKRIVFKYQITSSALLPHERRFWTRLIQGPIIVRPKEAEDDYTSHNIYLYSLDACCSGVILCEREYSRLRAQVALAPRLWVSMGEGQLAFPRRRGTFVVRNCFQGHKSRKHGEVGLLD